MRLCALPAAEGLARGKKEYGAQSREAAKQGSLSAVAESQTVRTPISLRLCALARRKKKKISLPAILRGRLQSRQDAKSAAAEGKNFSS
jgi:hypothetical protein